MPRKEGQTQMASTDENAIGRHGSLSDQPEEQAMSEYRRYLALLKRSEFPETPPGEALRKLRLVTPGVGDESGHTRGDRTYHSFRSAQPRYVSPDKGIPHHRYSHDEFSLIRLPDPAISRRNRRSENND